MTDEPEGDGRDTPSSDASWIRKNRRRLGLSAIAIAAVASWQLGWWQSTEPADSASNGSASQAGDSSTGLTSFPIGERSPLPALAGRTLDGDQLDVQSLVGHVVVLNVWGSWCGPCRAEAPDLERVQRETFDKGVRFVGIDTRDTADAARAFLRRFSITYPSLVDKQGELLLNLNGVIPISAVPSTVIVDATGDVAAKVVGRVDYTTLRGIVRDLLKERVDRPGAGQGGS